ncbi:MAG TPA: hypothetical protein VNS58_03050 [Puia sp.]|nr:hypothetical protein [Puia sp.]
MLSCYILRIFSFIKLSIPLVFLFSSCSYSIKEFNLSNQERKLLAPFKKADTLYFESSRKEIDTVVVLGLDSSQKKEMGWLMAKPAYNEVSISVKCFPEGKWIHGIFYDSVARKADTEYNKLITIGKYPQEHRVRYFFSFKDFFASTEVGLGELHPDTLLINGRLLTNYYIITDSNPSSSTNNPIESLFWTEKSGLVAYKYMNGIYWIRKNIKI